MRELANHITRQPDEKENHGGSENKIITYWPQVIKDYQGNPLIEALPEILPFKEVSKKLEYFPDKPLAERELAPELRVHCVKRLKALIYPLPEAIEFDSTFSQMIRQGYMAHNPYNPETWKHRYALAKNEKAEIPTGFVDSSATCLLVTGCSGMGKSTMVKSVLRQYDQVIRHKDDNGTQLNIVQITYIKISIPYDGLLSGLCLDFFGAVDKAVGTNFLNQYSGAKINLMLKKVEEIAANYFIGAIIIDELNNLNLAKAGGALKVLSYFKSLIDNVGIPLILIGTYSAIDLFATGMQDARRATEEGIIDIYRPEPTDEHWNRFLDQLQEYMWVDNKNYKFPQKIRDIIYYLTQGITDFAVRLIIKAQKKAIMEGKKALSEDLLKRTSQSQFRLLLPAIAALRSGDENLMRAFDDLLPKSYKDKDTQDQHSKRTPAPTVPTDPLEAEVSIAADMLPPKSQDGPLIKPKKHVKVQGTKSTLGLNSAVTEPMEDCSLKKAGPGTPVFDAVKAQGLHNQSGKDALAQIVPTGFGRKF